MLVSVAGCGPSGPSDFFLSLDADKDKSVDLQEWMAYYGPHDHAWENCSGKDFEEADCNDDLRLSWPEYHVARFTPHRCDDAAGFLTVYRKPELNQATGRYVTVPPACRISLAQLASARPVAAVVGTDSELSICDYYGDEIMERRTE
ncbi:MAG: hypothetical protein AAFX56_00720 [Pseudomonadota bacterium]